MIDFQKALVSKDFTRESSPRFEEDTTGILHDCFQKVRLDKTPSPSEANTPNPNTR